MYRAAVRSASRRALGSLSREPVRTVPRRFASTASPADRPRSWKSSALRWGLAIGAVYYYNTSSVFSDEAPGHQTIAAPSSFADSDLPTVDAVIEEKRKQFEAKPAQPSQQDKAAAAEPEKRAQTESQSSTTMHGSPEALEEEASQEGAFNPETGEINWDCPCLGGMAHGPCGEEFKTAFSCFVYSTDEPKGMNCIEKFQGMQECFRKYPDIYGAELADDDEPAESGADGAGEPAPEHQALREDAPEPAAEDSKPETHSLLGAKTAGEPAPEHQALREDAPEPAAEDSKPETHSLLGAKTAEEPMRPKWQDATAANNDAQKDEGKDSTARLKAEGAAKE